MEKCYNKGLLRNGKLNTNNTKNSQSYYIEILEILEKIKMNNYYQNGYIIRGLDMTNWSTGNRNNSRKSSTLNPRSRLLMQNHLK